MIVLSSLLFGSLSLATAYATSFDQLLVLRLLTGVGLGGALPNAISLASEYAPKQHARTTVATLMHVACRLARCWAGWSARPCCRCTAGILCLSWAASYRVGRGLAGARVRGPPASDRACRSPSARPSDRAMAG
ncbi:MFS transporter [Cupriavidus basilensis]